MVTATGENQSQSGVAVYVGSLQTFCLCVYSCIANEFMNGMFVVGAHFVMIGILLNTLRGQFPNA